MQVAAAEGKNLSQNGKSIQSYFETGSRVAGILGVHVHRVPCWANAVTGLMAMFCGNDYRACMRGLKPLRSCHDEDSHKKSKPGSELKPSAFLLHVSPP